MARGAIDALIAACAAFLFAQALILTADASALPYYWLAARVGWLAAPLVTIGSPILLLVGIVLSLAHGEIFGGIVCGLAASSGGWALAMSYKRQRERIIPDLIPVLFLASCVWWWVVAWRRL